MTDRRNFLKSMGLASLGIGSSTAALNTLGLSNWLKDANAAHEGSHTAASCGLWGDLVGNVDGWDCGNHGGFKILEIYLRFGASQWETFWLPGSAAAPNFSDFDMGLPNTAPHPGDDVARSTGAFDLSDLAWTGGGAPCQAPDLPTASTNSKRFANQTSGGYIHWGAAAKPLYRRSHNSNDDIFERCRMVTQYHRLTPHEAAIPYALTGSTLGNPRMAGTGAAIQRRSRVLDPNQLLPVSYVLYNGDHNISPQNYAATTGTHPGSSRPLVIQVSGSNAFYQNLARTDITSQSDDVLKALRHEYRDRLRFRGSGNTVRSGGFDGYWTAAELLETAPNLQSLFENELLVVDSTPAKCADVASINTGTQHGIKTQLEAAAELLSNGPAKYVFTMDNGITGSYDTHGSSHQESVNANMYNFMTHLASVIHHPTNNPTGKINLDDTMIVINSEFGRTPWRRFDKVNDAATDFTVPMGRDHWPFGYSAIMIGGPISGGPSIRGKIDSTDGFTDPDHQYTPTDIRGAMLLAAGIDPFDDGNFNVASFSDAIKSNPAAGSEEEIRERLKSRILGL